MDDAKVLFDRLLKVDDENEADAIIPIIRTLYRGPAFR